MDKTDRQPPGLYRGGSSLLHRIDPRIKLGLLPILIITLFASPDHPRLLVLIAVAAAGLSLCGISFLAAIRRLLILRWLLLFSLIIHLFFTPGRTLFATSWLSYDGLLRGLTVDLQLMLALLFSYLLALTTSPKDLAWGVATILGPLGRLGLPVRESGGLLLLVLNFIPLVKEEAVLLRQNNSGSRFIDRAQSVAGLIGPLLLRLVDRADSLSHEIVAAGLPVEGDAVKRNGKINQTDRWVLICSVPVFAFLWML